MTVRFFVVVAIIVFNSGALLFLSAPATTASAAAAVPPDAETVKHHCAICLEIPNLVGRRFGFVIHVFGACIMDGSATKKWCVPCSILPLGRISEYVRGERRCRIP